jgi:two-component system cell cycle sensor histidine kinase/response regulator CckA
MSDATRPDIAAGAAGGDLSDPAVREALHGLVHVALALLDSEGRVISWNRGCEALTGRHAGDVMLAPALDVLATADDAAPLAALLPPRAPKTSTGVAAIRGADRTPVPVLAVCQPVRAGAGDERAVHALLLTPLAPPAPLPAGHTEQMLRAEKLESLGILAGGMAHDFNNLLLGVVGNADLLLMELPADSPLREHAEQIAQSGLRASDLCNQLLAFSGRGKVLAEPTDISALVNTLAPLLVASLGGAQLRLDLARELPAVDADVAQIRQVVLNLAANAGEALDGRPGAITIRTRLHDGRGEPLVDASTGRRLPAGDYVALEVHDDGPGIAPDHMERIFEPFYTTKFLGRGLGLAAVRGIVKAHHGAIVVASRPGHGATITVCLPSAGVRTADAWPADHDSPVAVATRRTTSRIMVVDDEEPVRRVAHRLLARAGFDVCDAIDGLDALGQLDADPDGVDLVLLDMSMPGLDGMEVLNRIRRRRRDLPVLLSSGYGRDRVGHVLDEDAACGFIQKPYRREDLIERAAVMLEQARTGR